jgi:hypothetical protein
MDQMEVWTDTEGQRFLVAFVAIPSTSSITIDRDRATLLGRARIARMLHQTTLANSWRAGEWRDEDPLGRGRLHAVAIVWTAGPKPNSPWLIETLSRSQQWVGRLSANPRSAPPLGAGDTQ